MVTSTQMSTVPCTDCREPQGRWKSSSDIWYWWDELCTPCEIVYLILGDMEW